MSIVKPPAVCRGVHQKFLLSIAVATANDHVDIGRRRGRGGGIDHLVRRQSTGRGAPTDHAESLQERVAVSFSDDHSGPDVGQIAVAFLVLKLRHHRRHLVRTAEAGFHPARSRHGVDRVTGHIDGLQLLGETTRIGGAGRQCDSSAKRCKFEKVHGSLLEPFRCED